MPRDRRRSDSRAARRMRLSDQMWARAVLGRVGSPARHVRRPGTALVLTIGLWGCFASLGGSPGVVRTDVYFSEWQRIEAVREFVEGWRIEHGAPPRSLAGLCAESTANSWLCREGRDGATRDRWGRALHYVTLPSGGYSVGTAGPDGVVGNDDDLIVRSDSELARVRLLAGCYGFDVPDDSGAMVRRVLSLDTIRFSALRAEWRALGTAPAEAVPPKWHPWREDSVLVSWAEVSRVLDLRLAVRGDSILGVAHSPGGVSTWWDQPLPFEVRGARLDCRTMGN